MNKIKLEYKQATLIDIRYYEDKLFNLHTERRDCNFEYPSQALINFYSNVRECKVIMYNDKKIGYVQYVRINDYIEIKRLWIEAEWRGIGIATQVIEELFLQDSNNEIELHTYTLEGFNLFKKLNFVLERINKNGSLKMILGS